MPSNKGTHWRTAGALGVEDSYKHYKLMTDSPVSLKVYRKVVKECNSLFMDEVIVNGREMRLPYLSTIQVRKRKALVRKNLDYEKLNVSGKLSKVSSVPTYNFKARIYWNKHLKPITGKNAYSFKLARAHERLLRSIMSETQGHINYIEKYGK